MSPQLIARTRSESPIASVIIPTWSRRSLLRRLLFSLVRQDVGAAVEIIVVDSLSADGTSQMLKRFSRRVKEVVHLQTDNEISKKRNAGAALAHSSILVFFDDDMFLDDRTALSSLIREVKSAAGPVCFRVSYPPEWCARSVYYRFKQESHSRTNASGPRIAPWRFVTMAFGIYARQYFDVGGFDESFKDYGCEDHAFEFALREKRILSTLSQTASVLHMEPSKTFSVYRKKLVVTSSVTMPILFDKWPVAKAHGGISLIEGRFVGWLLRAMPHCVIERVSTGFGAILDAWPASSGPGVAFRLISRLFVVIAYLEGRSLRARS